MICFDFRDLFFKLKFNELHFVGFKKDEKKKSINSQCNEQRLDLHYPPLVRSLRVCTEIKKTNKLRQCRLWEKSREHEHKWYKHKNLIKQNAYKWYLLELISGHFQGILHSLNKNTIFTILNFVIFQETSLFHLPRAFYFSVKNYSSSFCIFLET